MLRVRTPLSLPSAVLGLLLAVWISLGVWICLSAPFASGTDESIRSVAFAAATNRRPLPEDAAASGISDFYYPPLYFLLFAPFYGDEPSFTTGFPALSGNIRMRCAGSTRLVTTEELAAVPPELLRLYRNAKLLSLLFGIGIVACLVASLRLLFSGENGPWLVLGTVGPLLLLPQFLYYHTLVNNDCLVNLLCAMALSSFIATARRSASGNCAAGARWGTACAACAGLGLLTKQSAIVLAPLFPALIWMRWHCKRDFAPRHRLTDAVKHGIVLASVTVAAGGWWVIRSWLTGDPAGLKDQRLAHGWAFRPIELPPGQFASLFSDVARTFIAWFAGSYYGIPDRIYAVYLLVAVGLLLALASSALRHPGRSRSSGTPSGLSRFGWAVLVAAVAFNLALVAVYNVQVLAPQGRLLFPTLIASGALFAGSLHVISGGQRRVLAPLVSALVLVLGGLLAWVFTQRMVPAVTQPAENLVPLGVVVESSPPALGPIWGVSVQQPLLLPPGRLAGFRILIGRSSSLPQFGTVLHARLRTIPAFQSAGLDLKPSSLGENGSLDRWTDIELEEPLDLPDTTPGLLLLRADKAWFRTPGSDFYYEIVGLENSPRLKPMYIDGQLSQFGLAISAVYQ